MSFSLFRSTTLPSLPAAGSLSSTLPSGGEPQALTGEKPPQAPLPWARWGAASPVPLAASLEQPGPAGIIRKRRAAVESESLGEPAMATDPDPDPASPAEERLTAPALDGETLALGPAMSSGREVPAAERDREAAAWLPVSSAASPMWLAAGGGLLAAVSLGGGGAGGVNLPVGGAADPSSPAGALSMQLRSVGPLAVQGLPSSNDPVVTVGNLEKDGAWYYRVDDAPDWVRGQGTEIPAHVFLGQGRHSVAVRQVDLAGNQGPEATLVFWFDSEAPHPALVALKHDTGIPGDGLTSDTTLVVSGVEAGGSWHYSIDGGDWQQGQGDELPADAITTDGAHTVAIVVRDATGNESAPTTVSLHRDTTGPTDGPRVSLARDSGTYDDDLLTMYPWLLFDQMEAGARWTFSLDGGATWIDAPNTTGIVFDDERVFDRDGSWTVLARQIDAAGNRGTGESTLTFELDREAPGTPSIRLAQDTGLYADDLYTSNGTILVEGVPDHGDWGYRLDDGVTWTTPATNEISHFVFSDRAGNIIQGRHVVEVRVWDEAGNRSTSAWLEFYLDTLAPGAPSLTLGPPSTVFAV